MVFGASTGSSDGDSPDLSEAFPIDQTCAVRWWNSFEFGVDAYEPDERSIKLSTTDRHADPMTALSRSSNALALSARAG